MSDLFTRHGIEYIQSVARGEVQWWFEDTEEVGTSDVSTCVRCICERLEVHPDHLSKCRDGSASQPCSQFNWRIGRKRG